MANILEEVKKCITFIFVADDKGKLTPNGTGFFVGVNQEDKPGTFSVFLITAKHVLQDKNGAWLSIVYIRLNKKEGDSQVIKIELNKTGLFTHTDNDVDIVAFGYLPDQNIFDFKFLPDDLIATKEIISKHEIAEGEEIFFTGLFTSHIGQKQNQPIIRFGRVALITDEKIEWKEKKDQPAKFLDLYLLECQSFGGNSGSPVFFRFTPFRKPGQLSVGGPQIYLAGVMKGSFLSGNEIQVTESGSKMFSLQNIGIAAVIPAHLLHGMLFDSSKKIVVNFN